MDFSIVFKTEAVWEASALACERIGGSFASFTPIELFYRFKFNTGEGGVRKIFRFEFYFRISGIVPLRTIMHCAGSIVFARLCLRPYDIILLLRAMNYRLQRKIVDLKI